MHALLPPSLHPTETLAVKLDDASEVVLPLCRLVFDKWQGNYDGFTFGGKPIISYRGTPMFAELAVLSILTSKAEWDGVWVETYGGTSFLREMPTDWNHQRLSVQLPAERDQLLSRIWQKAGSQAAFDVFGWQRENVVFFEAKRRKKDRLSQHQPKFIKAALECGLSSRQLIIVEWDFIGV